MLRLPDFMTTAHSIVLGCQPYAPAAFPGTHFHYGAESTPGAMVWSEGNMSLKNPVTPPAIDPGTVRLVAQRLNHYATIICMADNSDCRKMHIVVKQTYGICDSVSTAASNGRTIHD